MKMNEHFVVVLYFYYFVFSLKCVNKKAVMQYKEQNKNEIKRKININAKKKNEDVQVRAIMLSSN